MKPSLPGAWTALVPSNPLPQPRALPSHPGPKLLPPSSFMPRGVEAPARVSPPGHLGSHSLAFGALPHALGAVVTAVLTASRALPAWEDAGRPLVPSSAGAPVLGTHGERLLRPWLVKLMSQRWRLKSPGHSQMKTLQTMEGPAGPGEASGF